MTIDQIQLANTFDVWRIRTNQLITISNDLKEGNLLSTGTVTLSNPSRFEGNVTLNVSSGMIYGDGGLLSNVGKPKSITNDKLLNSNVKITATQGQIVLSSGTIELGSTVYLNVANLVTVNTDTSVANIASANLANAIHMIAIKGSIAASKAYDKANAANSLAETANQIATLANTLSQINYNQMVGFGTGFAALEANSKLAYGKANAANLLAFNTGIGANAFAAATIAGANTRLFATIAGANTAVGAGANNFLLAVIDGANTAVGDGANTFLLTTLDGANTEVGTGANTFLLATLDGANTVSIGAYDRANSFIINYYAPGSPPASNIIYFFAAPYAYSLPSSLSESIVVANNRPSGSMSMTILKNGSSIGSINFSGGSGGVQETATFTFSSGVSFARGDTLGIRNSASATAQLQNVMFSIVGYRT